MLKGYEYLDFKVLKEDWNEYKIEDDNRIRVKFVMVKILRKKTPDGYNFKFSSNNVIGIYSSKSREPGARKYTPQEIFDSVIQTNMDYKPITEVWNKYLIEKDKSTIEAKIVITDIQKSDKIDDFGDPNYLVKIEPVFRAKKSDKVR